MSASWLIAAILSFSFPKTLDILNCLRWSHFSTSVLHVSSATLKGAITNVLSISPSNIKSSIAVKVLTVLP